MDEEDDAFKCAKMENDGVPSKQHGRDKFGGEKGESRRHREEKGKSAARPSKE